MATTKPSVARKILDQFAALPPRERLLALVALVGSAYLVCDLAWYRPQQAQAKALQAQVDQIRAEAEGLSRAVQTVNAETPREASNVQRAERDRLRAEVEQAEDVVRHAQASVRVGEMIRTLATPSSGVTVVSLHTLPSTVFFNAATAQAAAAASSAASSGAAASSRQASAVPALQNIYRHGVEVTLRGPYPALVSYLQALEQRAAGVYWGPMRLDVVQYPETTLKVTLYMISVQPDLTFE